MIKLIFHPLSNQNSSFLNTYYSRKEEYLQPSEIETTPVYSDFNGENKLIQTIIYNTYTCNFYFRDSLYTEFQKVIASSKIIITEIGDEARFTNETFELVDTPVSEPFAAEFWKVTLKLKDLSSKVVEDVISNTINEILSVRDDTSVEYTCNVPYTGLDNIDMVSNLVEDIKDRNIDFNKSSIYKELRLYLSSSEILLFYDELKNVGLYSDWNIFYKSVSYYQYEIEKEFIGNDLFEINMKLYVSNEITVPNV